VPRRVSIECLDRVPSQLDALVPAPAVATNALTEAALHDVGGDHAGSEQEMMCPQARGEVSKVYTDCLASARASTAEQPDNGGALGRAVRRRDGRSTGGEVLVAAPVAGVGQLPPEPVLAHHEPARSRSHRSPHHTMDMSREVASL
jgi:hypothetical protein